MVAHRTEDQVVYELAVANIIRRSLADQLSCHLFIDPDRYLTHTHVWCLFGTRQPAARCVRKGRTHHCPLRASGGLANPSLTSREVDVKQQTRSSGDTAGTLHSPFHLFPGCAEGLKCGGSRARLRTRYPLIPSSGRFGGVLQRHAFSAPGKRRPKDA
ncbi:6e05c2a7-2fc9-4c29-ac40-1d6ecbae95f3 [Thermothielavioides terrestris]|uniref:6e05c2a7-2fc9-4c29-ac40-1d6ecbae95f3 n=1 Tax=Thermothielavioides terrestris TaxID=2587410 RepID=A0A3S4BZV1_9PEZI|nr:6e05c2a7-2fc9-4c29-ac40-1d6ecbae95f3 [Thermothielavioides terrestris]